MLEAVSQALCIILNYWLVIWIISLLLCLLDKIFFQEQKQNDTCFFIVHCHANNTPKSILYFAHKVLLLLPAFANTEIYIYFFFIWGSDWAVVLYPSTLSDHLSYNHEFYCRVFRVSCFPSYCTLPRSVCFKDGLEGLGIGSLYFSFRNPRQCWPCSRTGEAG